MSYAEMYDKIKDVRNVDIPDELMTFCKFMMKIKMDSSEMDYALQLLGDTQGFSDEAYHNVWDVIIPALRVADFIDSPLGKLFAEAVKYERNGNEFYTVDMGGYSLTCNRCKEDCDELVSEANPEEESEVSGKYSINESIPVFPSAFENWAAFRDWRILGNNKPDINTLFMIDGKFYLCHDEGFHVIEKEAVNRCGLLEKFYSMPVITVIHERLDPILNDGGILMLADSNGDYENIISDAEAILYKLEFDYPGYKYRFIRDPSDKRKIRVEITGVDNKDDWKLVTDAANRAIWHTTKNRKYGFKFIPYVSTF